MTPNLTIGYMAAQTDRGRLDRVATHGWLADEAAATRPRVTRSARLLVLLGAALVRLGDRLQGTARPVGTVARPAALPAR